MDHLSEVVDSRLKILLSDYYEFETLIKKLPKDMSLEMKNSIEAMEEALKVAPEYFDQNFRETMNQAIEVASNIEQHTKEFHDSMQSYHLSLNEHAKALIEHNASEMQTMRADHEKVMRKLTSDLIEKVMQAQYEANNRGEEAVKRADLTCNKLLKEFEGMTIVPLGLMFMLASSGIVTVFFFAVLKVLGIL